MNELKHYGVLGMKWGVRRFQRKDGTLTSAGKARVASDKLGIGFRKYRDGNGNYTDAGKNRYVKDKTKRIESNIDKLKGKNGKNVNERINTLETKKAEKESKLSRKYDINRTYHEIEKQSSHLDKYLYSSRSRKRAAKFVVDNNMSIDQAIKKAKRHERAIDSLMQLSKGGRV